MTSRGIPFEFNAPIGMWMDKSAPAGRQRRFGGLMTTDGKDRQKEIILQKGLDFDPFLNHGWFNDNHDKATEAIVGYPDKNSLAYYQKGEELPDGKLAPNNGHWAEGYMLENERGLKLWDTAQALAKSGDDRRLGFSVEGAIHKREGPNNKIIAKASVKNVAITNCPVQLDSRLETLAKSLEAVEASSNPEELWKALGMGTATAEAPQNAPVGPQQGETAGQVLAPESLEDEERKALAAKFGPGDAKKSLSDAEAITLVKSRYPNISLATAGRIIDAARQKAPLAA